MTVTLRPGVGEIEPHVGEIEPRSPQRYVHARRFRTTWDSRETAVGGFLITYARWLPLGGLLALQAFLCWRLIFSNTAFIDEATYLSAGNQLLHSWVHGGPNLAYETYFSGAPVIYPVIAALFDHVGGLAAARMFSMALMLLATTLAYASARRLGGTVAGWFAAAAFVGLQGTQYLGAFATFDAMSLTLLALAAWIVIRTCTESDHISLWLFAAVPVIALADATKYASAIFDPVIFLMALFLLVPRHGWRTAIRLSVTLGALTVALVSALLALAGSQYWAGITETTTNRAAAASPVGLILHDTVSWIGAIIALSFIGAAALVILAIRHRISWPYALLGVTLFGATILAPANQARIHTATSLSKHVNYGAWFGALLVGYVLSRVIVPGLRNSWRYLVPLALLAGMFCTIGTRQADKKCLRWINTTNYVKALTPLVMHTKGPILSDDVSIPTYYMGNAVNPLRWQSTFYFRYTPPGSTRELMDIPAYVKAVHQSYFSVIALDWGDARSIDEAISNAIAGNEAFHCPWATWSRAGAELKRRT